MDMTRPSLSGCIDCLGKDRREAEIQCLMFFMLGAQLERNFCPQNQRSRRGTSLTLVNSCAERQTTNLVAVATMNAQHSKGSRLQANAALFVQFVSCVSG